MKEIFATGSRGMVGSRFLELQPEDHKIVSPEIDEVNITDKSTVDSFFQQERPAFVVHFAAYTNVSEAENERGDKNGTCWKINVEGTRNLAKASKKNGAFMIYISTDMVFPGSKEKPGPYSENDTPEENVDKVTWYGYTKGQGEKAVTEAMKDNFAILRIIYPVRAKFNQKLDYIRKPLSLFDEGKLYPMFSDQQISISFIDEVCTALEKIISDKKTGIFHAASSDLTTPNELMNYVIEKARGVKNAVKASSLEETVRYPKYGGLRVGLTEKELDVKFSTWKQIVDSIVFQIST